MFACQLFSLRQLAQHVVITFSSIFISYLSYRLFFVSKWIDDTPEQIEEKRTSRIYLYRFDCTHRFRSGYTHRKCVKKDGYFHHFTAIRPEELRMFPFVIQEFPHEIGNVDNAQRFMKTIENGEKWMQRDFPGLTSPCDFWFERIEDEDWLSKYIGNFQVEGLHIPDKDTVDLELYNLKHRWVLVLKFQGRPYDLSHHILRRLGPWTDELLLRRHRTIELAYLEETASHLMKLHATGTAHHNICLESVFLSTERPFDQREIEPQYPGFVMLGYFNIAEFDLGLHKDVHDFAKLCIRLLSSDFRHQDHLDAEAEFHNFGSVSSVVMFHWPYLSSYLCRIGRNSPQYAPNIREVHEALVFERRRNFSWRQSWAWNTTTSPRPPDPPIIEERMKTLPVALHDMLFNPETLFYSLTQSVEDE